VGLTFQNFRLHSKLFDAKKKNRNQRTDRHHRKVSLEGHKDKNRNQIGNNIVVVVVVVVLLLLVVVVVVVVVVVLILLLLVVVVVVVIGEVGVAAP
jgi:uncharacterized membrane protein